MEKTFFEDFMNFQKEVPKIELNATVNTGKFSFKYADLPGILEVVRPILRNNNMFSFSNIFSHPFFIFFVKIRS